MLNKKNNQSGQALLIILLTMAVVLVVVLSILSRSVTDVSVSSQDEDSLRAFSAAEAGVEKALIIGSNIDSAEIGNATYSVNIASAAEGQKEFNYPIQPFSGESITAWFVAHDENDDLSCSVDGKPCFTGNSIKVCWGKDGSETIPALELSVFYADTSGNYSTIQVGRAAIDPNSSRTTANFFSTPDAGTCTILGKTYPYQKTISFADLGISSGVYNTVNGLQFMSIRSLYNISESNPIGYSVNFAGNGLLPSQGKSIDSSGSSGDANRRIDVFNTYPEVADIFEFGVYSSGTINK
jgi:hypothetical protein